MTPQPPDAFVEVRMRRRASYRRTLWLSVRMHQFSAFCGILSLALSVLLMVGTGNEPPFWSLAVSMALVFNGLGQASWVKARISREEARWAREDSDMRSA